MGLPGVVGVYGEAGNGAGFANVAEGLLEEGIDDLAKFRIILHLLQHPEDEGDAAHFAIALGFHSLQRTTLILEELFDDGLLCRQQLPGMVAVFSLAPDSEVRQRLRDVCPADRESPNYQSLLRALAQRSVARARAQSAKRRVDAA